MDISLVVAVAENGVIGRGGELPWRLSGDLQRFKKLTMGHPLLMGRKTYESIGRPLPGRLSIVLTRQGNAIPPQEGLRVAADWDEAVELAATSRLDTSELYVVGGANLYEQALPRADRLYRTLVHAEVEGDTRLTAIDFTQWQLTQSLPFEADERNDYPCTWEVWERIGRSDG